jgi:hypothetical protein
MNWKVAAVALGCCLPLLAASPRQSVEVTTTDRVPFGAGGDIHLSGSVGQLAVEGWDEPAVEITVTRTLFPQDTPGKRDEAKQQLDGIRLLTERRGTNGLVISTKFPSRKFPASLLGKTTASLDYRIRVPRDSNLLIQHDGDITIHGVISDIDASARGGIFVQIPGSEPYSIDARSRVGEVYSDFPGRYHKSSLLVGENFIAEPPASSHRLRLRVDVGAIDIQKAVGYKP